MTKAKLNIFGRVFVEYLIEGVVGGGWGGGDFSRLENSWKFNSRGGVEEILFDMLK